MSSTSTVTIVTIVGAGPTGLVAALTLVKEGVPVSIFDALPKGKNGSRAAVVHAHTLEVLEKLDIASSLVDQGLRGQAIRNFDGVRPMLQLPLAEYLKDKTRYPFVLFISQSTVEAILERELAIRGVTVHRGKRVLDMAPKEEGIELTLDDGSHTLSKYVIAADGSRSTIRQLAGITFQDPSTGQPYFRPDEGDAPPPTASLHLVLSDVLFEGSLPENFSREALTAHVCSAGFVLMIPLPSRQEDSPSLHHFRAVFVLEDGNDVDTVPDPAFVQEELHKRGSMCGWEVIPKVAEVLNISKYSVREAMADTMYKPLGKGHILLVGDSAHVHSPTGGQGMNLGICDAVALGRAVAEHIENGGTNAAPLEDYNTRRQTVARQVIGIAGQTLDAFKAIVKLPAVGRWLAGVVFNNLWFMKNGNMWKISGLANREFD